MSTITDGSYLAEYVSDLERDNERLREDYADCQGALEHLDNVNDELRDESAKLRELVEDMLSCIEIRAAFGRPPTEDMYEQFAKRARELGVEVDE